MSARKKHVIWYQRYGYDSDITDEEFYDEKQAPKSIEHSVHINAISNKIMVSKAAKHEPNSDIWTCTKGHKLLLCTRTEIKKIYGADAICDYQNCQSTLTNGGYHCNICPYDVCKHCIDQRDRDDADQDYIPSEKMRKQSIRKQVRKTRISKPNTHRIGIIHPKLISNNTRNNLLTLIKPIQSNPFTYRDSCFLIRDGSNQYSQNKFEYYNKIKPKIQELINPYFNLHLRGYETFRRNSFYNLSENEEYQTILNRNISTTNVQWKPSIFQIKADNTIEICSEIDSLPKANNLELYKVIQCIFSKLLSSIELVLNKDLKVNDTLYVYCKLQDYQFENAYTYDSNWHCEGYHNIDHIKCVALYYFDIKENTNLKLSQNQLILKLNNNQLNVSEFPIDIKEGMCVCFDNIKTVHKVHISANRIRNLRNKSVSPKLSRKCLSFFIRDPEYNPNNYLNAKDLHFVNYTFKLNLIFNNWIKHKFDISHMIIMKVNMFCGFDDGQHWQKMVSVMRKIHNPKWDRRLKVERITYPRKRTTASNTNPRKQLAIRAARKSAPACGD